MKLSNLGMRTLEYIKEYPNDLWIWLDTNHNGVTVSGDFSGEYISTDLNDIHPFIVENDSLFNKKKATDKNRKNEFMLSLSMKGLWILYFRENKL